VRVRKRSGRVAKFCSTRSPVFTDVALELRQGELHQGELHRVSRSRPQLLRAISTPCRPERKGDASTFRLDGDIGEIIAAKDVLAPSDQTGIESYLKTKWGTP
jgi:hypothetical protein